ncbi:MAG: serine/threonine transporter SstT [Erysipelotrichaceae bacterium]|nr:serine/threonine transporter SstT [Erysipelotrichaceae bacterium]
MHTLKKIVQGYLHVSLIKRILVGLIVGIILALIVPGWQWIGTFGDVFVGALKGIAPVLVFVLVISALAQKSARLDHRFGLVLGLYMLTTFLAALTAVIVSYLFPVALQLGKAAEAADAPQGIGEVLHTLFMNMVDNPVHALMNANYIGVLVWAVIIGLAFKKTASDTSRDLLKDAASAIQKAVTWIINLAPFGIAGIVYTNVTSSGLSIFTDYGYLLLVLIGCMLFVALVIDPFVAFLVLHKNPYPLAWRCLKTSGLTAFFTRSSAANIPVNMDTCARLGLDKDMYSVSIPLGATINMDGAAITITIMTLACAHTLGIHVDVLSAVILSFLSTLAACGASGVTGGSLLLIPMACSMFGISNDAAMQVVAIGFIIGIVQDSVETALNSAGDVMFAAVAEYHEWQKQGKDLPYFLGGTKKLDI